MRLVLSLITARHLGVLVDQLEVDVLERVAGLADREHVGTRRHERPR